MSKSRWILAAIAISITLSSILGTVGEKNVHEQQQNVSSDTPATVKPAPLSEEDFVVKSETSNMKLGGKYEDLITDERLTYARYLDEVHVYNTFVYESFSVRVSPAGDIMVIHLLAPGLQTARGISVGSSLADVNEKYGFSHKNSYEFREEYKFVSFSIDSSGKVAGIGLDSI